VGGSISARAASIPVGAQAQIRVFGNASNAEPFSEARNEQGFPFSPRLPSSERTVTFEEPILETQ
jgi:hypothetical protein